MLTSGEAAVLPARPMRKRGRTLTARQARRLHTLLCVLLKASGMTPADMKLVMDQTVSRDQIAWRLKRCPLGPDSVLELLRRAASGRARHAG